MRNAEAQIQAAIVADIRENHPDAIAFAVLNDGLYSKSEAAKRKWMGLLAGVPDVIVLAPHGKVVGLEVKTKGSGLSEDQARIFIRLHDIGIPACIVRSVEEARAALTECGITARGGANGG